MNQGSDNMGSTRVADDEHRAELQDLFGLRYERIQTGVHGIGEGNNRRERRYRKFRKPDYEPRRFR